MFSITTKMMCLVNGKMRMDPKEFHMAQSAKGQMPNIFFFANVYPKKIPIGILAIRPLVTEHITINCGCF